jgi:hypothetical protein
MKMLRTLQIVKEEKKEKEKEDNTDEVVVL